MQASSWSEYLKQAKNDKQWARADPHNIPPRRTEKDVTDAGRRADEAVEMRKQRAIEARKAKSSSSASIHQRSFDIVVGKGGDPSDREGIEHRVSTRTTRSNGSSVKYNILGFDPDASKAEARIKELNKHSSGTPTTDTPRQRLLKSYDFIKHEGPAPAPPPPRGVKLISREEGDGISMLAWNEEDQKKLAALPLRRKKKPVKPPFMSHTEHGFNITNNLITDPEAMEAYLSEQKREQELRDGRRWNEDEYKVKRENEKAMSERRSLFRRGTARGLRDRNGLQRNFDIVNGGQRPIAEPKEPVKSLVRIKTVRDGRGPHIEEVPVQTPSTAAADDSQANQSSSLFPTAGVTVRLIYGDQK